MCKLIKGFDLFIITSFHWIIMYISLVSFLHMHAYGYPFVKNRRDLQFQSVPFQASNASNVTFASFFSRSTSSLNH